MPEIVGKKIYVTAYENKHLHRIANERRITQQQLFTDMITKLIADSYQTKK